MNRRENVRRFEDGSLITRDEAEESGTPWSVVMLYTEPVTDDDRSRTSALHSRVPSVSTTT